MKSLPIKRRFSGKLYTASSFWRTKAVAEKEQQRIKKKYGRDVSVKIKEISGDWYVFLH